MILQSVCILFPALPVKPSRSTEAAEEFKQFAQQRQTIIFTCHEARADLLNEANVEEAIELN